MELLLVESPNKAKTIQKYLGDDFIVIASVGHICDLSHGGKFGIGVDVGNNFKTHYSIMKDKIDILNNIINTAEKCDKIWLGLDLDRDGEAIANHLYRYLETINKPIKRIRFGEITKSAILKSIKDSGDIDQNMVKAQEARRILDRIVGFMVSPYLMTYYGSNLSAGRVQSVVVRMIVDREKEIDDFKPEEFWNIFGKFKTKNNEEFSAKFQGRPSSKQETNNVLSSIKKENEFFVSEIKRQQKKEKPCSPLITATLQQYMARKHSFDPERTMKSAQNLYENGFCSYIRTDSTRISDDALTSVREWLSVNNFDIPKKPNIYAAKDSAQDAHECIRPTNVKSEPKSSILSGDDQLTYKAIWEHFVASQMNPAIWDTLQVIISAQNDKKIRFSVAGKTLSYKGYLEIFGSVDTSKIDIPNLNKNDIISLIGNKSEQRFTQPSPRFNDASIVKELESRQIGRPATYAEIIKKVSNRKYVEKSGNTYRPTELGKQITDVLVKLFPFMAYDYTMNMEKQLDEIAAGKVDYLHMLKNFFIPFKKTLKEAYLSQGGLICDKCENPMVIRTNSKTQQKFLSCSAFPRCKNIKNIQENTKTLI